MLIVNPEWFTSKNKLVIYTGVFVRLDNQRIYGQVQEIYGIIKLENMHALIIKNFRNLGAH